MNANKMTQKTLETLQQAQSLAEERRNTQVGQIHVFHALLDDPDDLNAQLMASMGISTDELRAAIDTELDKQAHKMFYAYVLAKCEGESVNMIKLIEGGIFEFFHRIVLTVPSRVSPRLR